MCTSFGSWSMARDGNTCWMSVERSGFTSCGAVHVAPPSSEVTNRIFEWPAGSPKMRLVELFQAMYNLPFRAAKAGCSVNRDALVYLGKPKRPGPGLAAVWMVSRIFVPPQAVSVPGWVTGMTVGFGAPGTLNVAKWNVSPASSE